MEKLTPEDDIITSLRNPLIKRVRALSRRDAREAEGVVVVEGLRAIVEAVRVGAGVETILYAPDRLRSPLAHETLARAQEQGVQLVQAGATVLDALSERDASQGAIAIVRRPQATVEDIPATGSPLVIALSDPQDPGNVGTIMRAADGAGAAAVAIIGKRGVDPFDPKAIRASMGSIFALPIVQSGVSLEALTALRSRGLSLVGTSDKGAVDLWDAPLSGPVAILMGN
ncbi:MAG TPA: RNA methyltransferase, partial [Ktedonobacterales bacterium]|nr:RNA methyltransferase [Ktedonobacterales bacterium]